MAVNYCHAFADAHVSEQRHPRIKGWEAVLINHRPQREVVRLEPSRQIPHTNSLPRSAFSTPSGGVRVRYDNYFVPPAHQALSQRPNVHLDTTEPGKEEIAHHGNDMALVNTESPILSIPAR